MQNSPRKYLGIRRLRCVSRHKVSGTVHSMEPPIFPSLPRCMADTERYTTPQLFAVAQSLGLAVVPTAAREQILSLLRLRLPEDVPNAAGSSLFGKPFLQAVASWRARPGAEAPGQHQMHMGRQVLTAMSIEELRDLAFSHGLYLDDDVPKHECVDIMMLHFERYHAHMLNGETSAAGFNAALYNVAGACGRGNDSFGDVLADRYGDGTGDVDMATLESFGTPLVMQANPARQALGGHFRNLSALSQSVGGVPMGTVQGSPGGTGVNTPPGTPSHSGTGVPPFVRSPRSTVSASSRNIPVSPVSVPGSVPPTPSGGTFASTAVSTPAVSPTSLRKPHPILHGGRKPAWAPPDRKIAKAHIDASHPRLVDAKTGAKRAYPVGKTRTGRHCFDCCDIFHEGTMSSFADLGAGVTL